MASESSSAVLDLNDADTEDTEAPSVTDDAHDGAPLIMEHGYDIVVRVDAPLKQLSTLETFVTYRVRCVCARWPTPPYVRRRYNHFKALHKRMSSSHPLIAVPPLPPLHSARQQLDRYDKAFVHIRTIALNAFLDRVAKHPILTYSEDFRLFLTTPDDELDKVFKSENSALNLWGLSTALYGSTSETKPTNGSRVKDPEFTSALEYLQSLQHKLTTLCTLTTKLHKGSAALGTQLMNMKIACNAWSSQALGSCAIAALGVGEGAGAAARALHTVRAPLRARACLPLLAAYCSAHTDKIRQRDAMYAAHIASNHSGETHNRLEQASEALRSELSDWTPKTKAEIKSALMELADRQVTTLTQILMGWESALKISTESNAEDLFKTVSKTAVQNLSPSKCRADVTPTETEKDFDDLDNYSDSDIQDMKSQDDMNKELEKNEENSEIFDKLDSNVELESDFDKLESKLDGIDDLYVNIDKPKENGGDVSKRSSDSKLESSKISDPLQDFSEIDLSS